MQNRVLEKASVEAVKKILLTSHEGWGEEGLGL